MPHLKKNFKEKRTQYFVFATVRRGVRVAKSIGCVSFYFFNVPTNWKFEVVDEKGAP